MTKGKKTLKTIFLILVILIVLVGGIIFVSIRQMNLTKVDDFLYEINAPHISEDIVDKLISGLAPDFGCTSFRRGSLVGRNFDWLYDNQAEFIVRTRRDDTHYASIGVASTTDIDNDLVAAGRFSPYYYLLSAYVVDGINEKGLAVNINSLPTDDVGATTGTNPGKKDLCQLILVRYLLDYADSVDKAIELIQNRNIYAYADEEYHFMISDPEKTVIVEFVDNQIFVTENRNIMTNYYVSLDEYTDHAEGVERYQIVSDLYDSIETVDDVLSVLSSVWYTKSYDRNQNPFWYSEYYEGDVIVDGHRFCIHDDPAGFESGIDKEIDDYNHRTRESDNTWQSVHSSAYDLDALTLDVIVQESGIKHHFSLNEQDAG